MSTDHSLVTMQSHPCPLSRTAIKCNRLNLFESKKLKTVSVIEIGESPSIMVEKVRSLLPNKIESKVNQFILLRPTSPTICSTETISVHAWITGLKSLMIDLYNWRNHRNKFRLNGKYIKKSIPESVTCRPSPALSRIPQGSKLIESCSAS